MKNCASFVSRASLASTARALSMVLGFAIGAVPLASAQNGEGWTGSTGPNDCNGNGIDDQIDIASAYSRDVNGNGVPDECEGTAPALAPQNPGPTLLGAWESIEMSAPRLNGGFRPFERVTRVLFEVEGELWVIEDRQPLSMQELMELRLGI